MIRPARLGLVPASRPSDVLSLTGFGGFTNGFGTPAEFTAVLRTWEERFGAVLCGVGFADVRVLVTRPPRTRRAAELVAAEIRAISREFWPIERPGTALTSVREIAEYVKDAPFWGLWWDALQLPFATSLGPAAAVPLEIRWPACPAPVYDRLS